MYRAGRNSVRERIITAEVRKLEREQAARRGHEGCAHAERGRSQSDGRRPPATLVEEVLSFLWGPGPDRTASRSLPDERRRSIPGGHGHKPVP
jgi:hypothetical protein